ncbi:MAG: sigma 54-interacting transcriptional regulator [Gemmatimonadaceae bacterium]
MPSPPRVLVVDTDVERALTLRQLLGVSGFDATHAIGIAGGIAALERSPADVIVVVGREVGDVAALLGEADDALVVVRLEKSSGLAWPARSWGVYELVDIDASSDALIAVVDRASREASMRRELSLLRSRMVEGVAASLIGRSGPMQHVRELIGRAAASQRTVLVTGEAGVGKDTVARLIHDLSDRAARPYLLVRCSEASAESLEQELFGIARSPMSLGRVGLLETARGGTVVLDDCTSLTASLRTRVAQAIINRAAPRLGGDDPMSLDVRFVLMARDSEAALGSSVRPELLLAGVSVDRIVVPPLRERRSDIPLLVQHFRARLAVENQQDESPVPANSIMTLMAQQWPGNVRELEHRVERDVYGVGEALPVATSQGPSTSFAVPLAAPWTLEQLERRYIEHVLAQVEGNQSRAAERLGIDRRTLYRKLKDYRDEEMELSQAG